MLWLNDTRESIKKDNPGIKVTEIAKKGGEMWRELKDKSVSLIPFKIKKEKSSIPDSSTPPPPIP